MGWYDCGVVANGVGLWWYLLVMTGNISELFMFNLVYN